MDLPNSRVWAVTTMDCITLVVGAKQSTNARRRNCDSIVSNDHKKSQKYAILKMHAKGVTLQVSPKKGERETNRKYFQHRT